MNFRSFYNTEFSWKRMISSFILIAFFVYLGIGFAAYFFGDRLIFQPPPSFYRDNQEIIKLKTPSGEKISARFFKNETARHTILFSHGNAEDIGISESFYKQLAAAGFNVFAYDYRGYGTSKGAPSEQNVYEDAETAYDYLINELKIPAEKIIVHGRSLGGAVSIDLAARKQCGALIVESSFVSAFRVLTKYKIYPFDKFQSLRKIRDVKCPVLVIHGANDEIIPLWHGELLFAAANQPKQFYAIDKARHNDVFLVAKDEYLRRIKAFAATLTD